MKREKVIEMAKKSTMDYSQDDNWPFFTEELEQFARLVELETLEMAAKNAEKCELHDGYFLKNSDPRTTIANEIRNLKYNHDKE